MDNKLLRNRDDNWGGHNDTLIDPKSINIGRVNCHHFEHEICERILLIVKKMPKFLILNNGTSYSFIGNLTYESIEQQILEREFVEIARKANEKKDKEGITLQNMMLHPTYRLQLRYEKDEGFQINLRKKLTKNFK